MIKKNSINILKNLRPKEFIKKYWGKKHLFLENVFSPKKGSISKKDIRKLIKNPDIYSKVIISKNNSNETIYGPFNIWPQDKKQTLLIHNFNLIQEFSYNLINSIKFIPYCLHDDVMVSFSSKDGGVGAHIDSYDVFLVQAQGEKQWKIGKTDKISFKESKNQHTNIKFIATNTIISKAGDILYIPAFTPHHGISLCDECITYSIGFRSPRSNEIQSRYLDYLLETNEDNSLYEDLHIDTKAKSSIPKSLHSFISSSVIIDNKKTCINDFIGMIMSEIDSEIVFEKNLFDRNFFKNISKDISLFLDIKSRAVEHNKSFFMNGEKISVSEKNINFIKEFFDNKTIIFRADEEDEELKDLILYLLQEGYIVTKKNNFLI